MTAPLPRPLILLLVANAVLRVCGGASTLLAGVYLADLAGRGLGATAGLAGVLGAAAFGAEVVAVVPLGLLADALTPRLLMSAGAALGAVAVYLFGTTTVPAVLLASKLLEGVAAAAVVPALLAHVTRLTEARHTWRARAMSYFELSLLAGIALGGLVGARLWGRLQTGAFDAVAVAYLGCVPLVLAGAADRDGRGGWSAWRRFRRALRAPSLRRLAPSWLLVNAVIGLWLAPPLTFLLTRRDGGPQFLDGVLAGRPELLGWVLFGYAAVFGLGVTVWSLVLPRLRTRRVLVITLGAMLCACAGLFLLNHSAGASVPFRWLTGAATAICVMVESGFTPAALILLGGVADQGTGRGATMGLYSALLGIGAVAGSLTAGWLGDRLAVDGLIYATVVLAALALAFLPGLDGPADAEP